MVLGQSLFAANRYAVANGDWGSTSTWSATAGGPSGASVPTDQDTVYIIGFTVNLNRVGAVSDYACYNLFLGNTTTAGNIDLGDSGTPEITLVVNDVNVINGTFQVVPISGTRIYTMTIQGNLNVQPAGRFDMFGNSISDYCAVNFNGGLQSISGGGEYVFVDVTVNSSGIEVSDSLAILQDLVFIGGLIDLQGVPLVINGSITGVGDGAYIITDQPGSRVIKNNVTNTTRIPIGTSTRYLPIDPNPVGGASTSYTVRAYEVATIDGVQGTQSITSATGNQSHRVEAVWEITASPARSTDVRVTWKQDLEGAYFSTRPGSEMGIAEFTGGAWGVASQIAGTGNNSSNTVARNLSLTTTARPISVGLTSLVLPVRLANFSAVAIGNQVKLNWNALTTHLNSSFEVERSANGTSFTKLGTKAAALVGDAKYDFVDATPLAGNNYYRIKTIDETGKVSYSKSLLVRTGSKTFALNNLFPSVTTGNLNVVISSSTPRTAQVNFVDINGRVANSQILSIGAGNNNYAFNVNQLPAGLYTMVIFSQDERLESRFIKQ